MASHSNTSERRGILAEGEPFVWLTAGALAITLLCIAVLLLVVAFNGLGVLWPAEVSRLEMADGSVIVGDITRTEPPRDGKPARLQIKIGNRDLNDLDFRWILRSDIQSTTTPAELTVLERDEWGNFYGYLREMPPGTPVSWDEFTSRLEDVQQQEQALSYYHDEVDAMNRQVLALKDRLARLEHKQGDPSTRLELQNRIDALESDFQALLRSQNEARARVDAHVALFTDGRGTEKAITLSEVVRAYRPNAMPFGAKLAFYAAKLRELLLDEPRESNTEGGLFPAIFGTVMLIFFMSILSFPLGVVAGIYLRLYAREGPLLYVVRIAVNNLAGIPSIVYGIFGLGFFVYGIGGTLDELFFAHRLPTPTFGTGGMLWASLTLGLLTVPVVIVATEEALGAIPRSVREGSYALGATRFQTLVRVLLPMAAPGIMTGFILAMARAAGEVAPLMITGVVKLAPALPLDGTFPYLHLERKFMHLGFHIYDIGFQSPNVEAAKPMVFVTTLLLILIVMAMSSIAIYLRNRLRKTYSVTHL
jgi:phosphate transport system permease protein